MEKKLESLLTMDIVVAREGVSNKGREGGRARDRNQKGGKEIGIQNQVIEKQVIG